METNKKKSMVDQLKDYLKNTPEEQLQKDYESLKEWGKVGPNALEYVAYLKKLHQEQPPRTTIVKRVVNEIINMYYNNIIEDNGNEDFIAWCEDGHVFSDEDEQTQDECISLMEDIAPIVDALTRTLDPKM